MLFFRRSNVRVLKRKSWLGQAVVIILGAELLFLSGFTAFNLPTATGRNLKAWGHNLAVNAAAALPVKYRRFVPARFLDLSVPPQAVRHSFYSPTVPTAVFIGYMLGPALGAAAAGLYVLLGLLGPYAGIYLFASGGGLNYYIEPGMGYLLGLIPGCWCAGRLTRGQRKSVKQLAAVACSVLAVHIVGIGYVLSLCVTGRFSGALYWRPWTFEELRNLSWYQLPYDLVLSLLFIGVGFPFRWLTGVLTAPDTGTKAILHSGVEELG